MKRTALLLALLAGCAHSPSIEDNPDSLRVEIERNERALNALAAEAQVDCDRAGKLRDNVCLLSERICVLTSDRDDRCVDGRGRCQKARARVDAVCPKAVSPRR
jgi:hypothetical protein